jgi:AcrR family transcriptional regulator
MAAESLRERKKARTRAAIAQAALALFTERGYAAVTLADVAAAAEVGQRTLFRYFPDKEELLFAQDEGVRAQLRAALAARPAQEPPAAAVLEAMAALAGLWQPRHAEGRARRALIDAAAPLQARERAKHAAYEAELAAELVRRGVDGAPARLLARVAVGCFDEAVTRWLADGDPARPGLEGRLRGTLAELGDLLRAPEDHPEPVAAASSASAAGARA